MIEIRILLIIRTVIVFTSVINTIMRLTTVMMTSVVIIKMFIKVILIISIIRTIIVSLLDHSVIGLSTQSFSRTDSVSLCFVSLSVKRQASSLLHVVCCPVFFTVISENIVIIINDVLFLTPLLFLLLLSLSFRFIARFVPYSLIETVDG